MLLRLAGTLNPRWTEVELTLLDRHDLVTENTRRAYLGLDWSVTVICADALAWAQAPAAERYDLCVATLFLHHFDSARLMALLAAAATRKDAVTSVAAGFRGQELSAVWDLAPADWIVDEFLALPFTHCFSAVRACAIRAVGDDAR